MSNSRQVTSDSRQAAASCLCGKVRIKANTISKHMGACHCGMCRKWGGGPLLSSDCGTNVMIEGEENVSVYNSSEWAERGFCGNCGSHLFYRLKHNQQYIIPIGLFDDLKDFAFDLQVFIDKKPDCYDFANETENMTEAEVFAKYAPKV